MNLLEEASYNEERYNKETRIAFRRQTALQIYVPLVIVFLILVGMAAGFMLSGTGTFSAWADISLMLLAIPALVIGIILLVLTGGLVYGVSWLIKALPEPAWQIQQIFSKVAERVQSAADGIASPFIRVNAIPAIFKRGRSNRVVQDAEGEKRE